MKKNDLCHLAQVCIDDGGTQRLAVDETLHLFANMLCDTQLTVGDAACHMGGQDHIVQLTQLVVQCGVNSMVSGRIVTLPYNLTICEADTAIAHSA